MADAVYLRLFGPAQVEHADHTVCDLPFGKALALLGYLTAHHRPVSRERLADLFWPDKPADRGRANLSWQLHRLSILAPGCLEATPDTVRFYRNPSRGLDLDEFAAMAENGSAAALAAAVALYRGDLLEGLHLDGCADYEVWLTGERERWRRRAGQALSDLVAHHVERGEHQQGLRHAWRLLALEPWQEEAHRRVMRLLAESGQRGAALAQYEACCRALEAELGVGPSEEIVALYEQIRDGEITPLAPHAPPATPLLPHHNLPAQTTSFVGREMQLAEVRGLLARPEVRLLTLTGVGGTGKTRLALQVAVGQVKDYADGVYLVELAPLRDPALVVPTIAATLGVRESGGTPLIDALQYVLRDKERLLVIDNCEHVVEAAPAVGELLAAAPGLKVLATSRAPLHIYGEQEYAVPSMEVPDPEALPSLERLAHAEAVSLFVQSAQRVQPAFALSKENAPAVAETCARLDGLPLAIELAAARVNLFSPKAMLAHIVEHSPLGFLIGGPRDLPARQRTLRATIEWSYSLLTADEQRLFRHLSVFAGGCTLEAVKAVYSFPPSVAHTDVERPSSLDLLQSLVDQNLLQVVDTYSGRRFTMLETVREYAGERLKESGEAEAVRDRHAAYYAGALQTWGTELKGPRQLEALREIEADLDNARAAWKWVVDGEQKRVLDRTQLDWLDRALGWLCTFYEWRGRYEEGEAACQRAVDRLQEPVPGAPAAAWPAVTGDEIRLRVLARALAWQCRLSQIVGRFELADRCQERALVLLDTPELKDQEEPQAFVLLCLAERAQFTDLDGARRLAEGSLAHYQALGDRWGMAGACFLLGWTVARLGDYLKGKQWLEEGLTCARGSGDRRGIGLLIYALGALAIKLGQLEEGEQMVREAMATARELGDYGLARMAVGGLHAALQSGGRFVEARVVMETDLASCHDQGMIVAKIGAMRDLGTTARHLGAYAEARSWVRAYLSLSKQQYGLRRAQAELGCLALAEGTCDEAWDWLQQALVFFEATGRRASKDELLATLAYVARGRGQHAQARETLRAALRLIAESGHRNAALQSLPAMALLLIDGGEIERAVELYALASQYPYVANSRWFEDVAGREIRAAAKTLSPETVAAAQEQGRARDLRATVEELLAELAPGEQT